MVKKYVNIIWNQFLKNPPKLLNNCRNISTNRINDSRIRQCAAKQACSMIRSIITKHNKRLFKLKQLQKENKDTKYLQRKISLSKITKPNCSKIKVELDSRFIDFQEANNFDLFVQVKQIGNKQFIRIPLQHTKVSNYWRKLGTIKPSVRLDENNITLYFEIKTKEKTGKRTIGADQGQITCLSLSDGQVTTKNKHGYDLNKIQDILSRRTKGSKGFGRAQAHRKNYINWSLNQLNFDNVKEVRLEKINNIRKGKKNTRKLTHWTYTLIKSKLVMLSEIKGFSLTEQDNKFRSQRCSQCGYVHKSNRKGKTFRCLNCEFIADSDLNAASNHEVDLIELPRSIWQEHINRTTGFFWLENEVLIGQESIVPDTNKE
jgi:transposase